MLLRDTTISFDVINACVFVSLCFFSFDKILIIRISAIVKIENYKQYKEVKR